MKDSIILLGAPGSGKSYWGKLISEELKCPFYDLDKLIEQETSMSIHAIFDTGGESLFRKIESTVLTRLAENQFREQVVLALGGGTPAYNQNMAAVASIGKSVYLNVSISYLVDRLSNDNSSHRPLVKKSDKDSLQAYLKKLISERESAYLQADYMLYEKELQIKNFIKIVNDH